MTIDPVAIQHIPLGDAASGLRPSGPAGPAASPTQAFADALEAAIDDTNTSQIEADSTVQAFARGEEIPVHQVMLALAEADASMRLATAVTSRAIAAYQEIARLQV